MLISFFLINIPIQKRHKYIVFIIKHIPLLSNFDISIIFNIPIHKYLLSEFLEMIRLCVSGRFHDDQSWRQTRTANHPPDQRQRPLFSQMPEINMFEKKNCLLREKLQAERVNKEQNRSNEGCSKLNRPVDITSSGMHDLKKEQMQVQTNKVVFL